MTAKRMKPWITCFLVLVLLAQALGAAALNDFRGYADYTAAEGLTDPPEVTSGAAVVLELGTGTVLYAKNAFAEYTAASTQKILTTLIAVETTAPEELVTFSATAISEIEDGGHNYDVTTGEVMSMRSCLDVMMLASINEAANAVAEHIAGSLSAFAELMNQRAAECGAENSAFYTPSGLNAEGQHTTAFDMAMIAAECARTPAFVEIASQRSCSIRDAAKRSQGYDYTNHNKMMLPETDYYRDYVVWGKTGYTAAAKNTLVTCAEKNGLQLVCVILQGKGAAVAYKDTANLCDYFFEKLTAEDITDKLTAAVSETLGECTGLELDYTSVLVPAGCEASAIICTAEVRKQVEETVTGRVLVDVSGTVFSRGFTATPKTAAAPASYIQEPEPVSEPVSDRQTETEEQLAGQVTDDGSGRLTKWLKIGGIALGVLAVIFVAYLLLLRRLDKEIDKRRAAYENLPYARARAESRRTEGQ